MPYLSDHKNPDGSTNWETYRAADRAERDQEKRDGTRCSTCETYISITFKKGSPEECYDCKEAQKPGELRYSAKPRCPACMKTWNPGDTDDYDLYNEGEHEVTCPNCEHKFEVSTHVEYSFTSPERVTEEGKHSEE